MPGYTLQQLSLEAEKTAKKQPLKLQRGESVKELQQGQGQGQASHSVKTDHMT